MIAVMAYQCEHCGKIFKKSAIKRHERRCYWNPANKCCSTCSWFKLNRLDPAPHSDTSCHHEDEDLTLHYDSSEQEFVKLQNNCSCWKDGTATLRIGCANRKARP